MARKSRSKKRKAKKEAAPSQQKLEANAEVDTDTATIEPDDVVIGAPPVSKDQSVSPPIVRQAEVIEN